MRLAPALLAQTLLCAAALVGAEDPLGARLAELDRLLVAGDAATAKSLLPVADPAWSAQVGAYLANLAAEGRAGRLHLTPVESRVDGDVGAVLAEVEASGTRSTVAFYARRQGDVWVFLPTPTVASRLWYGLDDQQQTGLKRLADWSRARIAELARARSGGVATWAFGEATCAAAPLKPGASLGLGQRIETGPKRPGRLNLSVLHNSSLVLAANTAMTLVDEAQPDGSTHLVIDLHRGTVQADINDLGPYAKVRLRGASSDVVVTGTLFMVQRVQPKAGEAADVGDKDYIVQVRGNVKVRRRGAQNDEWTHLFARQGLEVGTDGLGRVEALVNRPDLSSEVYTSMDLRTQALASPEALLASGATTAGSASWTAPMSAEVVADPSASGTTGGTSGASTASGATASGATTAGASSSGGSTTESSSSSGTTAEVSTSSVGGATTLTTLSGSDAAGVVIDTSGQVTGSVSVTSTAVMTTTTASALVPQVDTAAVNQVVNSVAVTVVQTQAPPVETTTIQTTPPVLDGAPTFPQ